MRGTTAIWAPCAHIARKRVSCNILSWTQAGQITEAYMLRSSSAFGESDWCSVFVSLGPSSYRNSDLSMPSISCRLLFRKNGSNGLLSAFRGYSTWKLLDSWSKKPSASRMSSSMQGCTLRVGVTNVYNAAHMLWNHLQCGISLQHRHFLQVHTDAYIMDHPCSSQVS